MGRALVFFGVFLAVVAVPQIIAHTLNYLYPAQPALVEDEEVLRGSAAGFVRLSRACVPDRPSDRQTEGSFAFDVVALFVGDVVANDRRGVARA